VHRGIVDAQGDAGVAPRERSHVACWRCLCSLCLDAPLEHVRSEDLSAFDKWVAADSERTGLPAAVIRGNQQGDAMQILIWAVFLAGALASRYFFGLEGRFWYFIAVLLVILLFRRPLTIALTRVASKLGLMKATIDQMPESITLVKTFASDAEAAPVAADLERAGFVD